MSQSIEEMVKARLEAARNAGNGQKTTQTSANHSSQSNGSAQPAASGKKSANPNAPGNKPKTSLIYKINGALNYIFSHRGYFWLGLTIGGSFFAVNLWFYHDLLATVAGWSGFQQWFGAALISTGTTLFEITPVVWNRNAKSSLEMIFSAGSKPRVIPELDPNVVSDAEHLTRNYQNAEKNARRFFGGARWVAIAIESFLGFMFLGSIGAGMRGLFKLIFFLLSIFGTEWGFTMAIRAAQFELPPAIREQFAQLWGNHGQKLSLKKVETNK